MTVDTRRVRGRRKLRFRNLDDVRADVQTFRDTPHRTLGNWSLAQIVKHLGEVMHASIKYDGPAFQFPLMQRVAGRLLLRPYLLNVAVPAGIRLPRAAAGQFFFDATELDEAWRIFDTGVDRLARESQRVVHPLIGRLSPAQWNKFHLRHSEMHLGFVVPE